MTQKAQIICYLALFSLAIPLTLLSQEATIYTIENGLAHDKVHSIFQDDQKRIWAGTERGLARWEFEGTDWERYDQVISSRIYAILQDNNGHLWFGTESGLVEYDGVNWLQPDSLRGELIRSLFIDTNNNLWIGTYGRGVMKRSGDGRWKRYKQDNSGLISNYVSTINEDADGNLWFGSMNSGVCKFDGNSDWTPAFPESDVGGNKIHVIYKDHSDTLWVGTNNGVVRTYDGSRWDRTGLEVLPAVRAIAEDREMCLWFGTENNGLYKYDRISCDKPQIPGLTENYTVLCMLRDHAGYLWFGTDGEGICRLQLNWRIFNTRNSDLADNCITAIDSDANGNLWIGTYFFGIAKYDGVTFQTHDVNGTKLGMNQVKSIMVDASNRIWCATYNGAHCLVDESDWLSYGEHELAHKVVNTVIQDQNGIFRFGTEGGVSRFDGSSWTTIDTSDGLPGLAVASILEDQFGHLWFGTSGGVCEFVDDSVAAVYDKSNGLVDNNVTAIIQDKQHNFWFGTKNGISVFDGANWDSLTGNNSGLAHDNVKCLFNDRKDNIWIGTSDGGLYKFDGQFWAHFSSTRLGSNTVNAIFQDEYENFWFGTADGLVKYTPDKIAPETFITIAPAGTIGTASDLFVFRGNDTETPQDKLVYACCLGDSDSILNRDWSYYFKEPYYAVGPLDNGTYSFLVKAKDQDGNVDQSPAEYTFTVDITPPTTLITYPSSHEIISGNVPIIGSAFDASPINDFKRYWLNYAKSDSFNSIRPSDWKILHADTLSTPVLNDTLIFWDTGTLPACGSYFLRLLAEDWLGHLSDFTINVEIVANSEELAVENGGLINCSQNRIQLYIPPGALEKDITIHCSPKDLSETVLPQAEQIAFSPVAYHFVPDELLLKKPATLTLFYDASDIRDLNEAKLSLMRFVSPDDFELSGGIVDPRKKLIRTTINKLGTYILIEDNTNRPGQHAVLELNCQPRIFSPAGTGFSATTTISFRLEADSEISVKIYNLTGRLVRMLEESTPMRAGHNPIEWDGRDYNNEICPSDLYVVTIESEKEIKTKTVMILDRSRN